MIYRAILNLTTLCGCQGVNGGGWAHYVGQEKVRPQSAWSQVAFGLDWRWPPRQQNGTSLWYFATDQWRYDTLDLQALASAAGDVAGPPAYGGLQRRRRAAGVAAVLPAVRPQPDRPRARGASGRRTSDAEIVAHVVQRLKTGELGWGEVWCNFPHYGAFHRAAILKHSLEPFLAAREFAGPTLKRSPISPGMTSARA